jgi:hypothetical protein
VEEIIQNENTDELNTFMLSVMKDIKRNITEKKPDLKNDLDGIEYVVNARHVLRRRSSIKKLSL